MVKTKYESLLKTENAFEEVEDIHISLSHNFEIKYSLIANFNSCLSQTLINFSKTPIHLKIDYEKLSFFYNSQGEKYIALDLINDNNYRELRLLREKVYKSIKEFGLVSSDPLKNAEIDSDI